MVSTVKVTNIDTPDNTGNITFDRPIAGDGSGLTSLPAANLTGTVADARISVLTASKLTGALPAISGASLTNLPSSLQVFAGTTTRLFDAASGDVSYTGIGFRPVGFYAYSIIHTQDTFSWGFDDGTNGNAIYDNSGWGENTYGVGSGSSIYPVTSGANYNKGSIASFDADGFTISWTKLGSPAALTISIYYMCIG